MLVVREGNPENIQGWDDIVKPGVGIITPNPRLVRVGALEHPGRLGARGRQRRHRGGGEGVPQEVLHQRRRAGSGRDATTAFNSGNGDVLISYENEAILARQNGEKFDYVVPEDTLLIENSGAVLKDADPLATKWLEFVLSEEGQTEFAKTGFRPLDDSIQVEVEGANDPSNPFPTPKLCSPSTRTSAAGTTRPRSSSTRRRASCRRSRRKSARNERARAPRSGGPALHRRSRCAGPRPAGGLGLGIALTWFSLLVLIPLAAVVATAVGERWANFWTTLTNPQTLAAITLTVTQSLLVTALNVVMGTAIAWVLVRDRFWGKSVANVVIDIPFALPTIVAGLVLLALYGSQSPIGVDVANTEKAVFLALAFVTLPFVVRTVQPVLEELEGDVEEAAASLGAGRRRCSGGWSCRAWCRPSPPARRCPSRVASASTGRLSCSAGTCPAHRGRLGPVLTYIENGNAAAVRRRHRAARDRTAGDRAAGPDPEEGRAPWLRHRPSSGGACGSSSSATCSCSSRGRSRSWSGTPNGFSSLSAALADPVVLHALRMTAVVALTAVVINLLFGVGISLLLVRYEFPGKRLLSALIDVPLSVPRSWWVSRCSWSTTAGPAGSARRSPRPGSRSSSPPPRW